MVLQGTVGTTHKCIYPSPNPLCITKFVSNRVGIGSMQFASEERGEPKIHSLSPLMHLRACGRSELGGVRVAGARRVATREARAEWLRRRTGADAGHAKEERRAGGARRAAGGGAGDDRGSRVACFALGMCLVRVGSSPWPSRKHSSTLQ
jgi:hypothetical protein